MIDVGPTRGKIIPSNNRTKLTMNKTTSIPIKSTVICNLYSRVENRLEIGWKHVNEITGD